MMTDAEPATPPAMRSWRAVTSPPPLPSSLLDDPPVLVLFSVMIYAEYIIVSTTPWYMQFCAHPGTTKRNQEGEEEASAGIGEDRRYCDVVRFD